MKILATVFEQLGRDKKTFPSTCPRGFSDLPTTLRRVCLLQCLLVAGRKSHFGLWPLWPFEKASSHYKKIVSLSERKLATITHGTWESKTEKTFSSKYAMVEHSHMTSDVFWVFLTYHSMARANLNKSEKVWNSTTTASKYIPKRPRICIN